MLALDRVQLKQALSASVTAMKAVSALAEPHKKGVIHTRANLVLALKCASCVRNTSCLACSLTSTTQWLFIMHDHACAHDREHSAACAQGPQPCAQTHRS